MNKQGFWFSLVLILAVVGGFWWWNQQNAQVSANTSLISQLTDPNNDGYALATEPNAIEFPRDFGAHDDYKTEWWYYTGNLAADDGRQFGYQFTIFRSALTPEATETENPSAWRSNQVYLAHFTITDVANGDFYPSEQFARAGAELAGADPSPYRVWLNDWSVEENADGTHTIYANTDDVTLDITLTQTQSPVLHGEGGLSQKGAEVGNASYYYSLVQQTTEGSVRIGDETVAVTGKSWKDHEYSTSALSEGATGWDWFSIQLDNGNSLMMFQIRRADGSIEPLSHGSWIASDSTVTEIGVDDFAITVTDTWQSPDTNIEYPVAWALDIFPIELQLAGRAQIPNQELTVSTTYWEGAVSYSGTLAGEPVGAMGYTELTGYGGGIGE